MKTGSAYDTRPVGVADWIMRTARSICLPYLLLAVCLLAASAANAAGDSGSGGQGLVKSYPIKKPLVATVVGTPDKLKAQLPRADLSLATLAPLVKRKTPPTLRYARPLRYMLARQDHPAPLVFVISGTGSVALSRKCKLLVTALYDAGDNAACLPSPTSVPFILGAMRYPVPGHMPSDVRALYRMMRAIREDLAGGARITHYDLAGYSLGGTEAAFLARYDDRHGEFNFKRVLLLNPAVSLWASVRRMDRLFNRNLPRGVAGIPAFVAKALGGLKQIYAQGKPLRFDQDFLYQAYKSGAVGQNAGAIVALVFRLSLANMAFAADELSDTGLIVPRGKTLGPYAHLEPYLKRSFEVSFDDYINHLLMPYWNRGQRHISRARLIAESDLHSIRHYLAQNKRIAVFTNADDPILDAGDVSFLRHTFGKRARIRPRGGHMGNLAMASTIQAIQQYFAP